MVRPRTPLIIFALLIAATLPSWAQIRVPPSTDQSTAPPVPSQTPRTYSIRGTLRRGDTNGPAGMVQLVLTFYNGERAASGVTQSNGEFEFQDIKSGLYNLTAELEGYEPIRERIEVRNASKQGIMIYLRKTGVPLNSALSPTVSAHFLGLPQKAQDAYQKGMQRLYEKKDLNGGLELFQRAISLAPDCYEAYCEVGVINAHMKRFADAESAFRRSIELSNGGFVRSEVGLAEVLSNIGRYAEAEPIARKAVELDPNMWETLMELARAEVGLGQWEAAEKSALAARKIDASVVPIHLILANIHIHKTDYQAAIDDLETTLRIDPNGPSSEKARGTIDELRKRMASSKTSPPPRL